MDFQVKLRGNRIELGEIEETLRAYDGIEEAVVLVRDQESQDSKLVAYIVKDGEFPAPKKLREFVKSRLPDYMVPNIFVPIASMPVTQHGKLDRKALPWPIKESVAESKKTTGVKKEPDTRENVSKFLSDFMANAIGGEKLKEDSDLFDIGATSLTMAQLVEKFKTGTVSGSCRCVSGRSYY
jgi:polyketide synthase PksN